MSPFLFGLVFGTVVAVLWWLLLRWLESEPPRLMLPPLDVLPPMRWDVARVHPGAGSLAAMLAEGWEPFSVVLVYDRWEGNTLHTSEVVYLRRLARGGRS